MIRVTAVIMPALVHVLEHLKPEDQEEMEAVHGQAYSVPRVAEVIYNLATWHGGWLFWDDGPVAALGAYPMTPTCAGVWAFGTVGWPRAVPQMTRHVRRYMVPALVSAGFHRAECRALAKRTDTRRWLTALGAETEAVLSEFGARREDFILFAWHADEQANHPRRPHRRSHLPFCDGRRLN